MPPHDYSVKSRHFRSPDGRVISREKVRGLIDALTEQVQKDAKAIANKFEAGGINLAQFEIEMRELLKSSHIVAAAVGRGGRVRMTLSDWGVVGNRLKTEYGYLAKFVRKIDTGRLSKIATANRAKLYADGVRMTYHHFMRQEVTESRTPIQVRLVTNSEEGCPECAADEARGWVNVEDMAELGSRICGPFCRCNLVFSDDEED